MHYHVCVNELMICHEYFEMSVSMPLEAQVRRKSTLGGNIKS